MAPIGRRWLSWFDEIAFAELAPRLLVQAVRHVRLAELRDGLGPGEGHVSPAAHGSRACMSMQKAQPLICEAHR